MRLIHPENRSAPRTIAGALHSIGPAVLPMLFSSYEGASPRVRAGVTRMLNLFGTVAVAALPFLSRAIRDDSDREVRRFSARTLGAFGPKAIRAASLLVSALKDEYWEVRREAAIALGRVGGDQLVTSRLSPPPVMTMTYTCGDTPLSHLECLATQQSDQDGRHQPINRTLSRIFLRLHASSQPSGICAIAAEDQ